MTRSIALALSVCLAGVMTWGLQAQVTFDRLLTAVSEPHNRLTYSGGYFSERYSTLRQIDTTNVNNLQQKWLYQAPVAGPWQATPLVVDGMMYVTQRPNDIMALDAKTGRAFWMYRHPTAAEQKACCGANNRGVAIFGDTLYMGTLDAYLVRSTPSPAA